SPALNASRGSACPDDLEIGNNHWPAVHPSAHLTAALFPWLQELFFLPVRPSSIHWLQCKDSRRQSNLYFFDKAVRATDYHQSGLPVHDLILLQPYQFEHRFSDT